MKIQNWDTFWAGVLVAFSSLLAITMATLFGLLGDQILPSIGSFEMLVLVASIITIIGIEVYFAILLLASRAGHAVAVPWRKIDAFETRHGGASTAWAVAWSIVHFVIGLGLIVACIWLALQYIPIMEPRYYILGYLVVALAVSMFVMYVPSSARVFRQVRLRVPGSRPKMGRGTMVPLLVGMIALVPVATYHVPAYYIEKWGLDLANAQGSVEHDIYGGWLNPPSSTGLHELNATGFFQVVKVDGRYWLVDPLGNPFISKGVNFISYWGDNIQGTTTHPYGQTNDAKYGTFHAWANATFDRMRAWHFNTLGAWCNWELYYYAHEEKQLPYTVILNIADQAGADWLTGTVADYWGDAFVNGTQSVIQGTTNFFRTDPYCIGYFLDNELNWGSRDWRSNKTLVELYLNMNATAPGRIFLLDFLKNETASISTFNAAFGTSMNDWSQLQDLQATDITLETDLSKTIASNFKHAAALQYFTVGHDALRLHAPGQLILGARFATNPGDEVVSAAKGLVDVISFAGYGMHPPLAMLDHVHEEFDMPVLIEEFSIKGSDAGLPNTRGAGPVVPTQFHRGLTVAQYIKEFMEKPYAVGYHWFQWSDEPAEGRFDGENSNFGLVTEQDEPWSLLVDIMAAANLRADVLHAGL